MIPRYFYMTNISVSERYDTCIVLDSDDTTPILLEHKFGVAYSASPLFLYHIIIFLLLNIKKDVANNDNFINSEIF